MDPQRKREIAILACLRVIGVLAISALLLQVLGGYSCAEIAAILGTSEGAVMTRLTRARQALRPYLRDNLCRDFTKVPAHDVGLCVEGVEHHAGTSHGGLQFDEEL